MEKKKKKARGNRLGNMNYLTSYKNLAICRTRKGKKGHTFLGDQGKKTIYCQTRTNRKKNSGVVLITDGEGGKTRRETPS